MTRVTDDRTRRALIIGVDSYSNRPLDGCVADARLMERLLRERFDFRAEHVRTLINGEATRDAVLAELDALIDLTAEDDVVFVFYAGHGSLLEDDDGDEGSGFDSTLMVSDTPRQDILDDEIHDRLQVLGEKTPYTTLVVDACNSGTITRDALGASGRSYPPEKRSKSLPAAKRKRKKALATPGAPAPVAGQGQYTLIAACRDDEIAFEADIGGDPELRHGALTFALHRELQRAVSGDTWRDIFQRAAAAVSAAHPKQHPQLEGNADRELFGTRELAPVSFIGVTARATDTVALSAGVLHGATVGSTYTVFAPGAKWGNEGAPLGTIEVVVAKGTSSRARIVEEAAPGAIVEGARAVENRHAYTDTPLAVQLVAVGADSDDLDALRKALDGVSVVKEVRTARAASVRVLRLAPRDRVGARDPLPVLGIFGKPLWALVDREGRLVAPADPKQSIPGVVHSLIRRASYENALALDNVDARSRMRGKVTLQLLRKDSGGAWVVAAPDPAVGLPVFDSGDAIGWRISSTLAEPVFVHLLDFDPLGDISRLTDGSANTIAPGKTFEIGTGRRGKRLHWDGPDGVESFKLFATKREVDFAFLERSDGAGRGVQDAQRLSDDDWTSQVQQILIRRRIPLADDGRAVVVDGATVTVRGLTGVVRSGSTDDGASRSAGPTSVVQESGALAQALAEAGMVAQQSILLDEAEVTPAGTRGEGGEPAVELKVPDPGEEFAQVAMTVDESGLVSWHFAPDLDEAPATRGEEGTSERTRTFRIPITPSATGDEATRGLLTAVGQRLIQVYAFPAGKRLVGHLVTTYGVQLELQRTPYQARTFLPDDYASADAQELGDADWQHLATGRALLMIHGTNSRTHTAFGGLPRDFVASMHRQYEGRVFAFDHPTLTVSPRDNIETLLAAIPDGLSLDVDIICHSRGGLVSRVLSEKQGELPMGARSVRVGKVIFVGTPNAGTRLADEACIGDYIDTVTNLLNALPTNGVTDALGYVLTGVKLLAAGLWSSLKGLQSMQPGGAFGAWLNAGERVGDTLYFALTSDYTPRDARLAQLMANRLVDKIFQNARNDMVVPTDGVYAANGSAYFPIADRLILGAGDGVAHTHFFQYPATTAQLSAWLAR